MKTYFPILVLVFSANALVAVENDPPGNYAPGYAENAITPESVLSTEVSEIAAATTMSRKTKEKLIISAVRLAINAAIQGIKDPTRILEIATQLTSAAAKAAPSFADSILEGGASVPSLGRIDGAVAVLQAAVKAGVDDAADLSGSTGQTGRPASAPNAQFGGNTGGSSSVIVSPSS